MMKVAKANLNLADQCQVKFIFIKMSCSFSYIFNAGRYMCEAANRLGTNKAYTDVMIGIKNITFPHENKGIEPNRNVTVVLEENTHDNKTVIGKKCTLDGTLNIFLNISCTLVKFYFRFNIGCPSQGCVRKCKTREEAFSLTSRWHHTNSSTNFEIIL